MEIIIKVTPEEFAAIASVMQAPQSGEAKAEHGVTADLIRNGVTVNYLIDGNLIRSSLEGKGEKK